MAAFDDEGKPLDNNELFAILLRHGVITSERNNRLAEGLNIHKCLPEAAAAKIVLKAREELIDEQRRQCREEGLDAWVEVKNSITDAQWNMIRRILPSHVMPSLYQMSAEEVKMAKRYGNQIRFHRTLSGFQADLSKLMPLAIMSNLIRFAAHPDSKLTDDVYVVSKLLIDGCNVQYINAQNLILAHVNLAFLPVDREVMMVDLYTTDEEQRAWNPAGQRGISSVTVGVCLGKENFGNLRANFTGNEPIATSAEGILGIEATLDSLPVQRLSTLCQTVGLRPAGKKEDLVKCLRDFIERNRSALEAEARTEGQELDPDCWTNLMERVPVGGDMFTYFQKNEGARYEALLPVIKKGPKNRSEWAKDSDGKVLFRTMSGRLGSTNNVDMKCRDTMTRFGGNKCGPKCCSSGWKRCAAGSAGSADTTARAEEREGGNGELELAPMVDDDVEHRTVQVPAPAAAARAAQGGTLPLPERLIWDPAHTPRCGRCCPLCDTPSHNHRRPLQFMTVEAIREQMGRPEGPLTLGEIADFYKIDVTHLIRWSTAAFVPSDLNGAPKCSCCFVQRATFTYSGYDVSAERKDKHLEARHLKCTKGNRQHELQRLLTHAAVCETAAQAPTLGLWGRAQDVGGVLGADTCVTTLPALTVTWAPAAEIPVVLAVRHIWKDEMRRGLDPVHERVMDYTTHIVGYLHSILLSLPRALMHLVAKIAQGKRLLDRFNRQHSPNWSAEPDKEGKLEPPTFHGPTARALIRRYAACIHRDKASDTFTLHNKQGWPLRGIVDDTDPNLHHLLAAFWWVDAEMALATKMFINKAELRDLFQATLEVTIRIVALSVFGSGYPLYAHYHLHAPWQLLNGCFQGWRLMGEDIGEAMHQLWKRLSLHTTRGGARGRLAKGKASDPTHCADPAAVKEQRIRSGDLYALHQMVRRYIPELMAKHKEGLSWFEAMKRDHPDKEVFRIFTDDVVKRTFRQSEPPSSRIQIGPYDVIDRIHAGGIASACAGPAADAGADASQSTQAGSKRVTRSDGPGSGNPAVRKAKKAEANQNRRAERGKGNGRRRLDKKLFE